MKKPIPFGKYYLLERINVGGMAEVFKAKTFGVEGFERLLAVKRILPNIAEDEEFIAMFIDEAKIAVQLQHANIAQIFDLGKVEDSYFIALEYVPGKDLRSIFDRLRGRGEVMTIQQACHIIMQVCEGLDYAHNKRDAQGRELHLVHRDISPQNVLIGYDGEVKLIDFGIAKAAGKASKTQAGILKGKFGYMSPEQVRGLPIDRRSDIFSVGIVLYELLTNERLFIGESDFSTLEKVRNVEIMPPSSYNKKIPSELERIVLKVLAKDPEDRYSNAIDLHDDLQSFLHKINEFYSRKDLAAWMKKMFAVEIEEDQVKLEQYRQLVAPSGAVEPQSTSTMRRAAVGGAQTPPPAIRPSAPNARAAALASRETRETKETKMEWDDEELDTQIFDKDDPQLGDEKTVAADDLFFEDDDRTVANAPPPDILEQARPPGAPAPRLAPPVVQAQAPAPVPRAPSGPSLRAPEAPALRPVASPPRAKATLIGVPAPTGPNLPPPVRSPGSGPNPAGPPQGLAALRRSGFSLPPPVLPSPNAPQPVFSFESSQGAFAGAPTRRGSRAGWYLLLLLIGAGVVGGTVYWNQNKPGHLQLVTVPADATVLVDNVKVSDHSPVTIDKPAGTFALAVTKDGYLKNEQNVEIHAGQPLALNVTLEPSPDTGFELSSDPPGGLVWLDGAPISGPNGQARTDFRAYRIPPGHHVLEIKGENRFRPWKEDIEVEPGAIQKVRATLVPSTDTGTHVASHAESKEARETKEAAKEAAKEDAKAEQAVAIADPTPTPTPVAAATPAPTPRAGGRRRRARETVAAADDTKESPKAAGDATGSDCTITIGSRPWSEVWIDGKNTNKHTPFADYKIACGKHKVSFKRADLQIDQTESITVQPGEKFKQSFTLVTDGQ
ncbi:MAG TPA: protein kinase [Polyangia bacterium]|nr:protein kinase [Polyangia bacterium]